MHCGPFWTAIFWKRSQCFIFCKRKANNKKAILAISQTILAITILTKYDKLDIHDVGWKYGKFNKKEDAAKRI